MPTIISGSTGISGTDGTAATPAVQGTDTNTGIFFPAADTIAFAEGGTEVMRIDSLGRLGVGTTSPQAAAVVSNAGAAGLELFTNYPGGGVGTYIQSFNRSASAYVNTAYDAADHSFRTSGTERARITSAGVLQFNSGYGSVATAFGCRAWVNFNGQGVVSIRSSGNVSSITDTNTGEYGVNFTTPMVDANYSAVVAHSHWGGITRLCDVNADGYTVNQFSMIIVGQQTTSWATFDPGFVCVSIFR